MFKFIIMRKLSKKILVGTLLPLLTFTFTSHSPLDIGENETNSILVPLWIEAITSADTQLYQPLVFILKLPVLTEVRDILSKIKNKV